MEKALIPLPIQMLFMSENGLGELGRERGKSLLKLGICLLIFLEFYLCKRSTYEGEFSQGNKHGKGIMKYASGNYYDGEWAADKKSGQGTMFWLTSNEKVRGKHLNLKMIVFWKLARQ